MWPSLSGKHNNRPSTIQLAHLRVQVFSTQYFGMQLVEKTRSPIATRPLADGLVEAIVEDVGVGERMVTWSALDHFGQSRDDLFAFARRQAAALETGIHAQLLANGIELLMSNGFYLSAALLEALVHREPAQGVLFIPLSWHHWCTHLIGELTVPELVPLLANIGQQIAGRVQVADAERLATGVYWYRPDRTIARIGSEATPELARALGGHGSSARK